MLNIRNPRAELLAKQLAELRKITMTDAVIGALEHEIAREQALTPLRERVRAAVLEHVRPEDVGGPGLTKEEIDAAWGQ